MSDLDRRLERLDRQITGSAGCLMFLTVIWLAFVLVAFIVSITMALTKWAGVW